MTEDLVARARALQSDLRGQSATIETARRVPPGLAEALAREGFFTMLAPEAIGGGEVSPRTFVLALEALALGDAATAWTVMTGSTTGLLLAYAPDEARALVRPETILAGVFAPMGRAQPVDGGYRVSGRWAWASGVENAAVRVAGGFVEGSGEQRCFFFRPEETSVLDTWDPTGLRGTGSHDMVVEDVFIPDGRSCVVGAPPRSPGPLYRFSLFGLLALGVSAVGLGIARRALETLIELAPKKKVGRRALAETETAQLRVAEAEGILAAARAFVLSAVDEGVWRQVAWIPRREPSSDSPQPTLREPLRRWWTPPITSPEGLPSTGALPSSERSETSTPSPST